LWPQARGAISAEALTGESDDDGRFQIDGAAPGRYVVEAAADEHISTNREGAAGGRGSTGGGCGCN